MYETCLLQLQNSASMLDSSVLQEVYFLWRLIKWHHAKVLKWGFEGGGGDFVNVQLALISIYKLVWPSCCSCFLGFHASTWSVFILSSLFFLFYFLLYRQVNDNFFLLLLCLKMSFLSFPIDNFTRSNLSLKPASYILSAFENIT